MEIIIAVYFSIIGMLLSSFYNVLGHRLPKGETIQGRSHCPKCFHQLRWIDIIPFFGYIINLGKCHFCGERIHIKYLLVELIGGLLFLASYLVFGLSLSLAIALLMVSLLIIQSVADMEHMVVLDSILLIILIPLVILRIVEGSFFTYVLSSVVLFVVLYLFALYGRYRFKKEALGGGDIKLYFVIGWILTLPQGLLSLFFASLFGLIYAIILKRDKSSYLPLVPFISLGVLIAFFFGESILKWYIDLLTF